MCGRFTLSASAKTLKDLFPLLDFAEQAARYNIAPTQNVLAVRNQKDTAAPELVQLRWGLIPAWADDPAIGNRMINARAETAATLPAFRSAFEHRRCLVLADGFFEWQKTAGRKQPYYIRLQEGQPFAFAGLWERWRKGADPIESCTILTTDANDLIRPLHDRMPVILEPGMFDRWLQADVGELGRLLKPLPNERMVAYPVSTRVNNARIDDPGCVTPLQPGTQKSLFE
jgi:putative SOS response-associated peptidase YedK